MKSVKIFATAILLIAGISFSQVYAQTPVKKEEKKATTEKKVTQKKEAKTEVAPAATDQKATPTKDAKKAVKKTQKRCKKS